jgi:peptidoglycan LD-endopeptidase LytH
MQMLNLEERLRERKDFFTPVVPYEKRDRLLRMDFTAGSTELTEEVLKDTKRFSQWVTQKLEAAGARYGVGGYGEHRTIYSRSHVFDGGAEPRRLHLGIDIWGPAYTPVFAPLEGRVHSFAFNDHFGDYGATLILQHELDGIMFHSLYGHLSLSSINDKQEGQVITKGERIAFFGEPKENGHWPPHLHFQLIKDIQDMKGDYTGVCCYSEKESYLANCPDPDVILGMMALAK